MVESLKDLLDHSACYQMFQKAIGQARMLEYVIRELGELTPTTRLLDVGCGPADLVGKLPTVHYVGVDSSDAYICTARQKQADFGTFRVLAAECLGEMQNIEFDLVIAIGLFHHLSDNQAAAMCDGIARLLAKGGRAVFLDPVYTPNQGRLARWIISKDRGRFVRDCQAYDRVLRHSFTRITASIQEDLLYIPYTHVLHKCSV
jgi:SAM-dependent methyltransferase